MNRANQVWTFYENGEIVNSVSRLCLDTYGYLGVGEAWMTTCEDLSDQMWIAYDSSQDGVFYLLNKADPNRQ